MASSITSGNATNGLAISSDNTGALDIKTGTGSGTTAISISSTQVVTGTAGNLMLISGTAVASTSGTSIDFTGIPSWAKRVTVMFQGVSTSGSADVLVQLGASAGVSTVGYLGASTSVASASPATSNYTAGFGIRAGGASAGAAVRHGQIVLTNLSGNNWVASGIISYSDTTTSVYTAGSISMSSTLDRVRITTSNGTDTFDAGSINILYE